MFVPSYYLLALESSSPSTVGFMPPTFCFIFKPGVLSATGRRAFGFLELLLSVNVCMHVCVCVCMCVHPRGYE